MQLNCKYLMLPTWLCESLSYKGLPLSTVVDLPSMAKHFTKEDISAYIALNECVKVNAAEMHNDELRAYLSSLNSYDILQENRHAISQIENGGNNVLQSMLTTIKSESDVILNEVEKPLSWTIQNMVTRVYQPSLENNNDYVVKLIPITSDMFAITFVLPEQYVNDAVLHAVDDSMKLLLTYYLYEDICQTPLFHFWCKQIRISNQTF